jgi:hypothetical protein
MGFVYLFLWRFSVMLLVAEVKVLTIERSLEKETNYLVSSTSKNLLNSFSIPFGQFY